MEKGLVSIVIPTFNCEGILIDCLESIKVQTYAHWELILVDSFSTDNTPDIGRRYGTVYSFGRDPNQVGIFAVPYQRNFGASKGRGEYLYWVDSDMRLPPGLLEHGVQCIEREHADAMIVPEVSYGEGFWTRCRALEKACYNASTRSCTDAARFIRKSVWDSLGGLDVTLGGNDDFDFQLRLDAKGFKTIKASQSVKHFEEKLSLSHQMKKKFRYGKDTLGYFRKNRNHRGMLLGQYSFLRPDFFRNYRILLANPVECLGMIFMKTLEWCAGLTGLVYGVLKGEKVRIHQPTIESAAGNAENGPHSLKGTSQS